MSNIAVVLMVKNEAARISETIKSCSHPSISGLVIYDTGSVDDTLKVIETSASLMPNIQHVNIRVGEFIDFATSRNACLDFAHECASQHGYDYFFLLDSNDELIIDANFDPTALSSDSAVWLITCDWKISEGGTPYTFKSTKLVRARVPELRWVGVVHEYLSHAHHKRDLCNSVRIYQDRIKDNDGKTRDRWSRDRLLLEREHKKNEKDLRSLFYLAQTYACLDEPKLAYEHYAKRTKYVGEGFYEEQFCSLLRCGDLSRKLNYPVDLTISWYMKAFMHSERAEPLVALSEIYESMKQYKLAYAFAKLACTIQFPKDSLLFIDKHCYEYKRWHILGRVAWYAAKGVEASIMKDGNLGCSKALKASQLAVDVNNASFYKDFPYEK